MECAVGGDGEEGDAGEGADGVRRGGDGMGVASPDVGDGFEGGKGWVKGSFRDGELEGGG